MVVTDDRGPRDGLDGSVITAHDTTAARMAADGFRAGHPKLKVLDDILSAGIGATVAEAAVSRQWAPAVFAAYDAPRSAEPAQGRLPLAMFRAAKLQVRAGIDPATVDRYAEAMQAGAVFPAIVVFRDADGEHHLADGHHRVEAARRVGLAEIDADIRKGDRAAALWHAVGANARHGLPLTPADRRAAVALALKTWPDKSLQQIAAQVGCSVGLVHKVKQDVFTRENVAAPAVRVDSLGRVQPTAKPRPPAPVAESTVSTGSGDAFTREHVSATAAPKPAPVSANDEDHPFAPDGADIAEALEELKQLRRIVEADDRLTESMQVIAELRAQVSRLEADNRQLTNDRADAIALAQRQRRALQAATG
jgi:hypothetical protein